MSGQTSGTYVAALYLRVSVEDRGKGKTESESIRGQRELLRGYIEDNEEFCGCEVDEYIDR